MNVDFHIISIWLILLLLPVALLVAKPLPSRAMNGFCALAFAGVILALAAPSLEIGRRGGVVIVLADRSASMPPGAEQSQLELVKILHESMGRHDTLGVVSFAADAAVEVAPGKGYPTAFTALHDTETSNPTRAVELALTLVPPKTPARILLLSDGLYGDAGALDDVALRCAAAGVAIDYRHIGRDAFGDRAVVRVDAPQSVRPGEGFIMTVWVQSPVPESAEISLVGSNGAVLASGTRELSAGLNRLVFRDAAAEPGVLTYTFHVAPDEADPVPENNRAKMLVRVEGGKPVLCVSPNGARSGLATLLRRGGVDVTARHPSDITWSLELLAGYSSVILENVSASQIGRKGMELVAAWVTELGGGLLMTGGKNAFGSGGYFTSPLDPVLPVSMELRQEQRKFDVSIAVAMDRSGSMSMPVSGGRSKMDLANRGVVEVLNVLGERDEIALFAVDTSAHQIFPMIAVPQAKAQERKILSVESQGGGIFVEEALVAAGKAVAHGNGGVRHIVLFADASDSEQPGKYVEILKTFRDAGITCSVVGLGAPTDVDAPLLVEIAELGGGEIYFTNDAMELPRLFVQDAMMIARSSFLDTATSVEFFSDYARMGALPPSGTALELGGYNLCYAKDETVTGAVSADEYRAPVVAFMQAGVGRSAAFAAEADGTYSGNLAQWPHAGDMLTSLARWTTGEDVSDEGLMVRQTLDGATLRIEAHIDDPLNFVSSGNVPECVIVRGANVAESRRRPMRWESPTLLAATVPLTGADTVMAAVVLPKTKNVRTLPPVTLPYSPEYAPFEPGAGAGNLRRIASVTGGENHITIGTIWKRLPKGRARVDLAWLFITLAVFSFVMEIIARRIGFKSAKTVSQNSVENPMRDKTPSTTPVKAGRVAESPARLNAATVPPKQSASTLESLRKAKSAARERMGE